MWKRDVDRVPGWLNLVLGGPSWQCYPAIGPVFPCPLTPPGTWAWPAMQQRLKSAMVLELWCEQEEGSCPGPKAAIFEKAASQAGLWLASGVLDSQRVFTVPQLTRVACCVQTCLHKLSH